MPSIYSIEAGSVYWLILIYANPRNMKTNNAKRMRKTSKDVRKYNNRFPLKARIWGLFS